MIPENTVLVLGAGASRPYMFPTAAELRNLILEQDENQDLLRNMGFTRTSPSAVPPDFFAKAPPTILNNETDSYIKYRYWYRYRLISHGVDESQIDLLQEQFRLSEFYSIDRFVAENDRWKPLASLAVACILLRCEQKDRLQGDWYRFFYNELFEYGKHAAPKNISIVTFNYDRSLEMYIWMALKNGFSISSDEAWSIIDELNIIHVYGDLGSPKETSSEYTVYGSDEDLRKVSERIQLLTPRTKPERMMEVETVLDKATKVVYLGFGFDSLNLKVVAADSSKKKVYSSCYHLSEPAKKRAEDILGRHFTLAALRQDVPIVSWGDKGHTVADFLSNSHAFVESRVET